MTDRSRTLLLTFAAVLITGLAIWATCYRPETSEGIPSAEGEPVPVPGEVPGIIRNQVEAPRVGVVRIVDQLSGGPLEISVTLLKAEKEESILRSGDQHDLSVDLEEAQIRYLLASGEPMQDVPLRAVAEWLDKTWLLRLPYSAGITATLHSPMLTGENSRGKFMLLPDFGPFMEEYEQNASPDDFMSRIPIREMSFEGKTRWFLKAGSLKPIGEVNSLTWDTASIQYAASGPHILGWVDEFGDSVFIPVVLTPGASVHYDLFPRLRPVLRGILLDWHGDPVPKAPISFVTSLDLMDYDNMPQDPHAMVNYEREGQRYLTMKQTYKTDEEGKFQYRVPRGQDYALWSHALGGYCFWSTRISGVRFSESDEIILQLQEPSPENTTVFQILWPSGEVFKQGKVNVNPAGDVPFFRQWPYQVPLDEHGEVRMVGFDPGILVGVRVFLDGGDWKNSLYAAPYINIPENRRVEIRLTEESVRKKDE